MIDSSVSMVLRREIDPWERKLSGRWGWIIEGIESVVSGWGYRDEYRGSNE